MTKTPLKLRPLGDFGTDEETDADLVTYIIVGRAVIHWANLEQNFNHLVARLYKRFEHAKEPPFTLGRKIKFWNECFKEQPELAHISVLALTFSRHFKEAKDQRDLLFHVDWKTTDDMAVPLKGRMLRTLKSGHAPENVELPLRAINGLVSRISRLNLNLIAVSFPLLSGKALPR